MADYFCKWAAPSISEILINLVNIIYYIVRYRV